MIVVECFDLCVSFVQGDICWYDLVGNWVYYGVLLVLLVGQSDLVILLEIFISGFFNDVIDKVENMDGLIVVWFCEQVVWLGVVVIGSVQLWVGEGVFN